MFESVQFTISIEEIRWIVGGLAPASIKRFYVIRHYEMLFLYNLVSEPSSHRSAVSTTTSVHQTRAQHDNAVMPRHTVAKLRHHEHAAARTYARIPSGSLSIVR